jgi:uncharacterized repeat protein (TIGR01451 family)
MYQLKSYRRFSMGALCILSLITFSGNSRQAIAAQLSSDVSVTITADRDKVRLGQNVTYTVTATNLGPDAASFVDVVHGLSDQLAVVSLTCDRGISPDGPFCEYSSLDSGATVVSTLVATPRSDSQSHDRKATTSAHLSFETADTVDPNSSNNAASVTIKLIGKLSLP